MRFYTFLSLLLFSMVLLTFILVVPVHASPTWNIQVIDKNNVSAGGIRIALDSNNNPHIAYNEVDLGSHPYTFNLMYASCNGSNWNLQAVGQMGTCVDLALDSNNNPHILYYDSYIGSGLKYASWTGTNWIIQTVDSLAGYGGSLALDSAGNPHIAYIGNNEQLKYASWTGSGWSTQTLEATGGFNVMSLALDSNNNPHIMYDEGTITTYQTSSFIRYAVWDDLSKIWNYQTVLANATIIHLALDSNSFPHFSSVEDYPGYRTFSYGSWNGSDWKIQVVASNIDPTSRGGYFALDSHNYSHIDYFVPAPGEGLTGDLMYARWTGTAWDIQTVDSSATGLGSIVLDSNGNPHIAYLGNITNLSATGVFAYLMYATATEPTPTPSPSPIEMANAELSLSIAIPVLILAVVAALVYIWKKKTQSGHGQNIDSKSGS